jgi:hypothetical protein
MQLNINQRRKLIEVLFDWKEGHRSPILIEMKPELILIVFFIGYGFQGQTKLRLEPYLLHKASLNKKKANNTQRLVIAPFVFRA